MRSTTKKRLPTIRESEVIAIRTAFRVACVMPVEALLTDVQLRLLRLMARGMHQKDAAAAMGIAYTTVQTHVKTIHQRLGTHTLIQAVAKVAGYGQEEEEKS